MLKKRLILFFSLIMLVTSIIFNKNVFAEGNINSEESRVITVARGSFEYEGEKYVAKRYFVDQLIAYLSREDVNLTADQADSAIDKIYANVETGVKEGYIVKIHDDSKDSEDKKEVIEKGTLIKGEDGSVTALDHDGRVVMKSDGLLRNTGFSLQNAVIIIVVLGLLFAGLLIYSVKEILFRSGGHYES